MTLSKNLKKIMVTGAAVLMAASTMAGVSNTTASAHRRYHYRYARVYRHRRGYRHSRRTRRTRRIKYRRRSTRRSRRRGRRARRHGRKVIRRIIIKRHARKASRYNDGLGNKLNMDIFGKSNPPKWMVKQALDSAHPSKSIAKRYDEGDAITGPEANEGNNGNTNENGNSHQNDPQQDAAEAKSETLKDINADREANGLNDLQETSDLDQIASMRAKQASQDFTHTNPSTGQAYYTEDANQLGHSLDNTASGENLASSYTGIAFQSDYRNNAGNGLHINNNGKEMADDTEDGLVNHDAPSWGHRANILGSDYNYVGIGWHPIKQQGCTKYTLAEDFAE